MWLFNRKGASGFSSYSTAEEVTHGIDGSGLTAIVTGASGGIGIETTRVLALRGVHVVMGVRNIIAGEEVKESIIKEIPAAKIDVMELDLSSMASVRKFASEYILLGHQVHMLINNAGIMGTPYQLSEDNIELQFATNHIGHFLLTNLLLDTMKTTCLQSKREGRIVNVSSKGHNSSLVKEIRFENINDQALYTGGRAYVQSKLANVIHANELTRRLKEEGVDITANSLHPGVISTNILRHQRFLDVVINKIAKFVLKSVEQGAATTCYVALHPQVNGISGEYFDNCNIGQQAPSAKDADLGKKLWDVSMKLTSQ